MDPLDALPVSPPDSTGRASLHPAVADWLALLADDVLKLVSAPRLYWIALALLIVVQAVAGIAWVGGEKNPGRWKTFKRLVGTGFKTAVVLLAVNIGGNAVPVLSWTIAVVWSGAIWLTVREIGRSATTAESELRKVLDSVWEEIRRRNRVGLAAEAAVVPFPIEPPSPLDPGLFPPGEPTGLDGASMGAQPGGLAPDQAYVQPLDALPLDAPPDFPAYPER